MTQPVEDATLLDPGTGGAGTDLENGVVADRPQVETVPHETGTEAATSSCWSDSRPMMSEQVRADVLLRLRKVNGQVAGITKMVQDDRYCVDVLQQLSAVSAAVDAVSKVVVRNYLERCVTDAINGGDPLIYHELMRVVFRHR